MQQSPIALDCVVFDGPSRDDDWQLTARSLDGNGLDMSFDHGPEFIAYAVADGCRFNETATAFIDPGSPWQNAWIESFNGRLRDESLNGQLFETVLEARVPLEDWRIDRNTNRPHSAHGWLSPAEFVGAVAAVPE